MLTITRRGVAVSLLATLLAVAGSAWAGTPEARAEVKRQEARITKIEARLTAIQPEGQKAEALATTARTMLGLSRRYLGADNAAAARLHADLAERFVALAEGKAVQQ
jgi:hypothetical protein